MNCGVLLTLENPRYKDMVLQYPHLKGIAMDYADMKEELLVYLILGTNEYAQVKRETTSKIGKRRKPIAELTHLG